MFLEKISNKSSLSQKVKQQSIIAKQQKLVIFLINLSNLVKMKNFFFKWLALHVQMSLQLMYIFFQVSIIVIWCF